MHAHEWTVVQIFDEPVGITCSCGDSRGLSYTKLDTKAIDLTYGQSYKLCLDGRGMIAAISSYQMNMQYHGVTELDVSFRILG